MGAVPGLLDARQIPHHLAHLRPRQRAADHDGHAAGAGGEHGAEFGEADDLLVMVGVVVGVREEGGQLVDVLRAELHALGVGEREELWRVCGVEVWEMGGEWV